MYDYNFKFIYYHNPQAPSTTDQNLIQGSVYEAIGFMSLFDARNFKSVLWCEGGGANKLKNIEPYPIELSRLETP